MKSTTRKNVAILRRDREFLTDVTMDDDDMRSTFKLLGVIWDQGISD